MADDLKEMAQHGDEIGRDPGEAICSWAQKLGVTAEELLSALEEVAPLAQD